MKNTIISRSALILALVTGFAFPAKAVSTGNSIVMTEVSNLLLTYSINGGMPVNVNASTPDHWFFTIPNFQVVTLLGGTQDVFVNYKESDFATSGLVNMVRFFQYGPAANGSEVTVVSDHLPTGQFEPGYPLVENGGTFTFNFADASTARFTDSADASESVPEGGSTVALLGIAFAGIEGVRRMVRSRKA